MKRALNKNANELIISTIKLLIIESSYENCSLNIYPIMEKGFKKAMQELTKENFFEKNNLKVIIFPTEECTIVNIVRNRDLEEWQERHIL